VGLIGNAEYADDVRSAEMFLAGEENAVFDRLTERMNVAATEMRYEDCRGLP